MFNNFTAIELKEIDLAYQDGLFDPLEGIVTVSGGDIKIEDPFYSDEEYQLFIKNQTVPPWMEPCKTYEDFYIMVFTVNSFINHFREKDKLSKLLQYVEKKRKTSPSR